MLALKKDRELAPALRLLKVVYEESEQRALILSGIDYLLKIFETYGENEAEQCVSWVFAEMLMCFKHPSFREEREWRLVVMYSIPKLVRVRISRGRLLPYIASPIDVTPESHPFVSVTHGPTVEADITQNAIKLMMKISKIGDAGLVIGGSDAPLRPR